MGGHAEGGYAGHKKGLIVGIVICLLLVVAIKCAYWWQKIPPKRPEGVPSSAVYIRWLPVGLPHRKHGVWINCWLDKQRKTNRCRVANVRGELKYEGVFLPYQGEAPVLDDELVVDVKATENAGPEFIQFNARSQESSNPGPQAVPFVYLTNGNILIPEKVYAEGKAELDKIGDAPLQ